MTDEEIFRNWRALLEEESQEALVILGDMFEENGYLGLARVSRAYAQFSIPVTSTLRAFFHEARSFEDGIKMVDEHIIERRIAEPEVEMRKRR